jgi:hypothetical protein
LVGIIEEKEEIEKAAKIALVLEKKFNITQFNKNGCMDLGAYNCFEFKVKNKVYFLTQKLIV